MINKQLSTVVGAFEYVTFPTLGIENTLAKVDTGAYSGAIHCSVIKVVRKKSGEKALRFVVANNHDTVHEYSSFIVARVRSSTGHLVKRYIIETSVVINQKKYTIKIGLSDRTDMQTEVLIGRRFLRENSMLVDVRINQEIDNGIGNKV